MSNDTAANFTRLAAALVAANDRVPEQRAPWLKAGDRVLVVLSDVDRRLFDVEDVKPTDDGLIVTATPVDVIRQNLAAIRHELETPMRGHDADGECCRRAQEQA